MPSYAKGRAYRKTIQRLGGLEWILENLSEGRSLRSLAREIGCGRWWLDRWIHADPARKAAIARARVAGAEALMDRAQEILDEAQEAGSHAAVAAAAFRAGHLELLAARSDPLRFGARPPKSEGPSLGELYLAAVREVIAEERARKAAAAANPSAA